MLIAAHDAIKSAAEANDKIPQPASDVDKKFRVAFDLLYYFVKDFLTLNPDIRDARFTQLINEQVPWKIWSSLYFRNLGHMRHLESHSFVEFPSDSSSLNADES